MQVEEAQLCGVILDPTAVIGQTATVQGTIILIGPAPDDGTSIALESDNPDVAKVEPSVEVPAGSNNAAFEVSTAPVDSPTAVTITASSQDVKRTATLTVQPPSLAQLTLNPAVVLGGSAAQGTVTLNGPAPANFVVALQSTDTSVATVPASVTVAANATSATFAVSVRPVPSPRQVNIVASRDGVDRSATLTVRSPAPVSFAFSPQQIGSGATSTGTITLNGPAPAGTAALLTGSNAVTADFPATVAVPANATQVTFAATGKTFTGLDRTMTVTASYLGGVQSATLTVEGAAVLSSVAVNPTTVIGRTLPVQGTVTLTDPAPAGGLSVALSSSAPDVAKVPSSVNVAAGSTTAQFAVTTEPVGVPTVVTIAASSQGAQRTATLTVQPPSLAQLTLNPAVVLGGSAAQGTVTLNGPAPANFVIALQSTDATVATVPAEIVISQNAASGAFPVTTRPVPTARQVVIVASRAGVARSATLTVQSLALVSFTFSPQQIGGGETSLGAIALSGPAPAGTSVALSRSNAVTADFPATVTVPAGATKITFTATGRVFIGVNRSVTVTATYLGTARTATLTVFGEPKDKEAEKVLVKEKEDEFLISRTPEAWQPVAADEEASGGAEERDAGRAFVRPAERAAPGRRVLDQPPEQE